MSGIGNPDKLKSLGIEMVHELKGVGENLQDHLMFRPIYKIQNIKSLNKKINSLFGNLMIGLEYVFNKAGMLSPFLGIGYGYTSDYFRGAIGTIDFKDQDQNAFFSPKAGVLYKLKNGNHLGLTVSYISEYKNDLTFIYLSLIHI